jgi:hypothetical protein
MSGRIRPAEFSADGRERTNVALDLEPYESRFLIFTRRGDTEPAAVKDSVTASLDLSRNWRVTFGTTQKTMDRLNSWIEDEATRYFSGPASYEKTVAVPESMLRPGIRLKLDLGEGRALPEVRTVSNGMRAWFAGPVREAAVVSINGRRAGTAWCPPYDIDVTGLLKNGGNSIVITVANTAVNYMAGRSMPDYRLLNQLYGKRFDPQDMDKIQPIDSGLFGPIRLIAFQQ